MADTLTSSPFSYPMGSFYGDLDTRIKVLEAAIGSGGGAVPDYSVTSFKLADGAVITAKVADANITYGKLAADVKSKLWEAGITPNQTVSDLADARTRLTAAEAKITWEKIAVVDFVSQTQLIQTDLGAFRDLRITLELEPGASATTTMQVSANNGGAWLAGGTDYSSIGAYSQSGVTSPAAFTITGSAFAWFASNAGSAARPQIETLTFGQFNKAKEMQGTGTGSWISGSQFLTAAVSMNYAPATALNALKFLFTVACSGRLIIEGIKG